MTKAYSIFLTVLFTVFIGGVLVISALLPKEEFSEMENRFLQKPPELSIETVKNGKFMENAEKYVSDHIAGRDLWVAAKAWGERLSGKQENNGVYFAAQDTLINRVEEPDGETWEQLDQNLEYLDQLVSNAGVPVYFGLIPSAAQVWHDRLPDGAPTAGEAAIIETLYSRTAARTVDLLSVLSAHSGEELYYRTDHHWTSLGAYYGYAALPMEPDRLTYLTNDILDGCTVYNYETGKTGSVYDLAKGAGKDPYELFLSGSVSLLTIENPQAETDRELVIFRDSFGSSLAPLLVPGYAKVTLADIRYLPSSQIGKYLTFTDQDVLFLYSAPVLNNSDTLK